ncbi:hypothetical protein NKDENANG_03143 [Candidatus Entotheonellaceae bacterium PAL068K]
MESVWESLEAIPSQYRWAMIPVILGLLWGGYGYFLGKPRAEEIARLKRKIESKSATLIEHRKIAKKYEAFEAKARKTKEQLRQAQLQLPKRKEIPTLIRRISDLGVRTGLQINLLKPQKERPQEFFAEIPILVRVGGPYHAVGEFFDALGHLLRIVSVSDIRIRVVHDTLETQCVATLFRFIEEQESPASEGG